MVNTVLYTFWRMSVHDWCRMKGDARRDCVLSVTSVYFQTKQMDIVTTVSIRNICRNPLVSINSNSFSCYMIRPSSHQCIKLKTVLRPNTRKCSSLVYCDEGICVTNSACICWPILRITLLTLILLTWSVGWAPNNARKWQMGFNSAFKGLNLRLLMSYIYDISSLRVNDLTLILLTWRKWWTPNNASKWQVGFNSAFKGLIWNICGQAE